MIGDGGGGTFLESVFYYGLLEYINLVSVHPYRTANPEWNQNDTITVRRFVIF